MKFLIALILSCVSCIASPFSIEQVGDIHSGNVGAATSNQWQSLISWTLANTNDGTFNIAAVVSPGDIYEQSVLPSAQPITVSLQPTQVFNGFNQIRTNGLLVFLSPGNHDCDATDTNSSGSSPVVAGAGWNDWLGTNWLLPDIHFEGTMTSNSGVADTRNMVMLYTNQGYKFIFISYSWATNNVADINGNYDVPAAYLAQTQWITNKLAQYSNHLAVVFAHHMLNISSDMEYWDTGLSAYHNIGPAKAAFLDGLSTCPNLFLILSGHNRIWLKAHRFFRTPNNNWGDVIEWDTQGFGPHVTLVNLVTINPELQTVFVNTYDISNHVFLTNGEYTLKPLGNSSNAFPHAWSFPLPGKNGPPIQTFRLGK